MIEIDGAFGEGGGQVLRTSLALSVITGKAIHITNIRGGRKKPGLLRQHLTCVEAARTISNAKTNDMGIGSSELVFNPGPVNAGQFNFAIGTAGSTTLVLQTILLPLALADSPSTVEISGGTHNPMAPPFDFIKKCWLPQIEKMGVRADLDIETYGFVPAGGGKIFVHIQPAQKLSPIFLNDLGRFEVEEVEAFFANLPFNICERELKQVQEFVRKHTKYTIPDEALKPREVKSDGPGNAVILTLSAPGGKEQFTHFGRKGLSAEKLSKQLADEVARFVWSGTSVGPYMADQLLLPMALAGGGEFTTMPTSLHTKTNAEIIEKFLPVSIRFETIDAKGNTHCKVIKL